MKRVVIALLVIATLDMPLYGDPNAPINLHVADLYLREAAQKTNVPNVVTAVLASYRGYDTMGETTVILTAGVGVTGVVTYSSGNHAQGVAAAQEGRG